MKKQISFIITSPDYDSGIKSMGSKCIRAIKKNSIIEKQIKSINKSSQDIDSEIIFVNAVDHQKTVKFIEKKNLNIKYVYLNHKNLNHTGCFLRGLALANYSTVVNIDCGLIMSHHAVSDMINQNNDCDINVGCVNNKHKQSQDLEIGCVAENKDKINNMFFGLEHKYIGTSVFNPTTKQFILDNFTIQQDKNKYIFEIINQCISKGLTCKKTDLKSKDTYLIFNKKSLTQYIG